MLHPRCVMDPPATTKMRLVLRSILHCSQLPILMVLATESTPGLQESCWALAVEIHNGLVETLSTVHISRLLTVEARSALHCVQASLISTSTIRHHHSSTAR